MQHSKYKDLYEENGYIKKRENFNEFGIKHSLYDIQSKAEELKVA